MFQLLGCMVLLCSSFLIQAYHISQLHPNTAQTHLETRNSADVQPNGKYVRDFYQNRDHPQKTNVHRTTSHILENGNRMKNNHYEYAEKDSGTNYPKLNLQKNIIQAFKDTSRPERLFVDNENGNTDRRHQDNYTGRQSRPLSSSNKETSNVQLVSRERSRNDQYEQEKFGNVKIHPNHDNSGELVHPRTEYPRYFAEDRELNHGTKPYHNLKEDSQRETKSRGKYPQQYSQDNRKNHERPTQDHVERFDYPLVNSHNAYSGGSHSTIHVPQNSFRPHDSPHPKGVYPEEFPPNSFKESHISYNDHKPNHSTYSHGRYSSEPISDSPPLPAGRQNEHQHYKVHQGEQDVMKHSSSNDAGQEERTLEKDSSNTKEKLEAKQDTDSSASEADSKDFVEEHDGFLDMGAYTDERGSFGWYADFPVGKEHDKVTYSFSK